MIRIVCFFMLFGFLFIQCNDENSNPLETPIFSLLDQAGIKIDTVTQAAATWEYGFKFQSLVNGTLSKLGILVPDTGTYKIRLYNLNTNQLLIEKFIESKWSSTEYYVNIPPVEIKAGIDFGVSLVADVFLMCAMQMEMYSIFLLLKGTSKFFPLMKSLAGSTAVHPFRLLQLPT